jgi:hypothetical protein
MIFKEFTSDDIVVADQTIVTTGLWSGDTGSLEGTTMLLYDTQVGKSGEYYLDVYDVDPNTNDLAEVQFAVTYGHINGGGAPTLVNDEQAKLPTKSIYSQYRNLLLDPTDTKFSFQGVESDHIYVINIQRARVREQLDPGNWQLPLSGANGVLTFIDDSNQTLGALTANSRAGRVYNVVSGSITSISGSVTSSTNATTWGGKGYGLVYPDLGIIVLNPDAICPAVGFYVSGSNLTGAPVNSVTGSFASGSTPAYNSSTVLTIDASATLPRAPFTSSVADEFWNNEKGAYNHAGLVASMRNAVLTETFEFRARSAETISSTHYFVRLRNKEFNYSNNPTFRNPDDNTLVQSDFKKDPRVYITTIGLYNQSNELLAVAKLSKPVKKSFSEEVLLRVRLDF